MANWTDQVSLEWAIAVTTVFPVVLLVVSELLQRALRRSSPLSPTLRSARNLLLPAAGLAALLHLVLRLPATGTADRVGLTIFWISALFVALQFVSDVVFGAANPQSWRASVPSLFRDLLRSLLVGVGAALIYSNIWNQELAGALAALGVGSLVIGLALQEPLGNVFSGLMLLFEHPVALGEWIQVGNDTGLVVEMNWRAVCIETITQETIIVPNSALYKTSFANLSRPTPLRTIKVELSFGYGDAPNLVKQVITELARETPGVLTDPPPRVHTTKYGDFAIDYTVFLSFARQEDLPKVRDEFMTRVWYAAQRAGLTIPYPAEMQLDTGSKDFGTPQKTSKEILANYPRFSDSANASNLSMRLLTFTAGEALLKLGDEQDGLGIILSGKCTLAVKAATGDSIEIGQLEPGDFYGEHSILSGGASSVAILAQSDVNVALFDLASSRQIIESSPKLAREVGEVIDRRREAATAALRRRSASA